MNDRLLFRHWVSCISRVRAKGWYLLTRGLLILAILLGGWLLFNGLRLQAAASKPIEALFVLGGGIHREMYVAQLAKQHSDIRILISQGSEDPCIWLMFQREQAPISQVWLEKCADSTFDNFYFNIPLLQKWGVRKVKLITSASHTPRSKWMAQILLGAHGIWVEADILAEEGTPGNRESPLKMGLDLTRSLVWAVLSQGFSPRCLKLVPLSAVDIEAWRNAGFKCERQQEFNLY